MFGIEIIEVGIGLAVTYLAVASLCSALVDLGVKITSYRSKSLKQAIIKILGPESDQIVQKLYDHHLITGRAMDRTKDPEWVDSKDFAFALVTVFTELNPKSEKIDGIRQALENIKDEKLKRKLIDMLEDSVGDVVKFREELAKWFDKSMEDVSHWYRARMRLFVSLFSILVVGAWNIDSLDMAKAFYTDNSLREATVAAAEGYIDRTADIKNVADYDSADFARIDSAQFAAMISNISKQVDDAHLMPIGWKQEDCPWGKGAVKMTGLEKFNWLMLKLVGLLITVAAVYLGAPYWRDQLKSLLKLRAGLGGGSSNTPAPAPAPITVNVTGVNSGTPAKVEAGTATPPAEEAENGAEGGEDTPNTTPV